MILHKLLLSIGLALALSENAFAEEAGQCAAIEKVLAAAPDHFVAVRGPQDVAASPGLYRTTLRLPGFASCRINTRELVFYACRLDADSEMKALEQFDAALLSVSKCLSGWEVSDTLPEGVPPEAYRVKAFVQQGARGRLVSVLVAAKLNWRGRDVYTTSLSVRFVPDEVGV